MIALVKPHETESPFVSWCGKRIEGIVFDVDGTLTNSIEAYFEVFRDVTARFGIEVKREDVLEPMSTGSLIWDRAIPRHIANRDEKIKRCMKLIPQIYREVFQRVEPFPGLELVLRRLEERGITLGVLTSSQSVAVQPLHDHSLSHYFKIIMTHEDGFPAKPAPTGILECLRRMGIHPSHGLTIGDSPLDIRAGKAAGTLTVGVLSGIGNRAQLEAEEPTAILEGVTELLSLVSKSTFSDYPGENPSTVVQMSPCLSPTLREMVTTLKSLVKIIMDPKIWTV